MDRCMAKTGTGSNGPRCSRKWGHGHKGHFCKMHADMYSKGSDQNAFHPSGWGVWFVYNYKFPGIHKVAIRKFKKFMEQGNLDRCAKKIQRAWHRSISDPSYKMCRDRLMREFQEL